MYLLLADTGDNTISVQELKNLEATSLPNFSSKTIADLFSGVGPMGLIPIILFFAGGALLIYLVYGGIKLMLSKGDPKAAQAARSIITNAFIGFLIIFGAFWLVQAAGLILGLQDITTIFGS
jgi:hypothetical protein